MESDILPVTITATGKSNFYPRSPHGERLVATAECKIAIVFLSTLSAWRATGGSAIGTLEEMISIHALRMESDFDWGDSIIADRGISIHALRMESDQTPRVRAKKTTTNFYPRSPHGERRSDCFYPTMGVESFLSTLSAWRATLRENYKTQKKRGISIHALRMESDVWPRPRWCRFRHFYPRSPHGERPLCSI